MSNFSLLALLTIACLASVAYATPRQLQALKSVGIVLPVSTTGAVLQGVFLSTIGAAVGATLSDRTGLAFAALRGNAESGDGPSILLTTLLATALTTIVIFAGHYVIYYFVFRPRLPTDYVIIGESVRLRMGILARVLQGGLVEEVQFRWGAMSAVVWLGIALLPVQRDAIIWIGITIAAILFGFFHLIGAVQLGIGNSTAAKMVTVIDNVWVGVGFGWLFWQYGLLAAIVSHALLHVIWFPIERFSFSQYAEEKGVS